jgi:branched-chain amino acid transport system permease protein
VTAAFIGGTMLGLLVPGAALAAPATATALSAASATPGPIDPDTAAESIQVWVRIADTKAGVPGVSATATGPDGFTATVVTGADGKVLIGLPGTGKFSVTLDVKTLPAGYSVPSPTRDVTAADGNKNLPAFFLLVSGDASGPTPSDAATTAPAPPTSSGGYDFVAQVLPRLASGLIFGLLLALASIGVSLIYGTTGLNNFAHGELVTFGGLMAYTFTVVANVPGWLAIIISTILGGAFGYVQDLGLWRPLRRKGVALIPLMIVSIGLSLAVRYIFQVTYGPAALTVPEDNTAVFNIGPIHLRSSDVVSAIICILVLLLVAFLLLRTKIGKATRAVSDNRALAAASGINVESVIRTVWVAGGALAGLAGALLAYYQAIRWDTGASILLLIFAAVTLGGLGTAFGALIGALVIGLFIDLSTLVLPANMKFVAALAVMIVILVVRPQGILGKRDRIG